ncbi:glycoside hydrolase family 127 protein [Kribbella speibonae]|uniref:Glycoside hydrolase family 127 protein n=1 Tax=Kribbella speibonae TaxID=1572660 RepID=A0A4V2M540_9ACTN|nr:beta-L-arabinofuranosidase domain-containing protein [Kribbella speibonae]TCC38332.1 glycoside hydrolase family 127 protein [Kribbella speibonae]
MSHGTEFSVELTGGLLHDWQQRNRRATIPHAIAELRKAGNLENLRRLADPSVGPYRGRYPFLDTDLYKTLEGLAYEVDREDGAPAGAREFFDEVVELLEQAQADDGYLNSYFQDRDQPKQPWSDLGWGHELYNLGHLIQAAVAAQRRLSDGRLLTIARRFADLVVRKYGVDGAEIVDGHPEVEMALVELYRETGDEDYLTQARLFVDRRGQGKLKHTIFPGEYFQDHVPFRELPSVTGHAVRMAYLAAGAADVHLETGDPTLLAALERLWDDMVATKLYLTGGLGSRHSDEAIGDRYELPSERAYAETCAAIATMQWAWRMFRATGKASYLDVYETVLYNAYAVGLSADGTAFFYDNPLQRRPDHEQRSGAEDGGELLRRSWFGCPCCPPNIIRWMSELQDHVAVARDNVLYVGMYAGARITADGLTVNVSTNYPWDGEITLTVEDAPAEERAIALRIPRWASEAQLDGQPVDIGWAVTKRNFKPGDVLRLTLPMGPRAHGSHPYLDATRGAIAVARGPLVYCVEQQDVEAPVDDLLLTPAAVHRAVARERDGHLVLELTAGVAPAPAPELYPVLTDQPQDSASHEVPVTFTPYFLWGNRQALAMRVWLRTERDD